MMFKRFIFIIFLFVYFQVLFESSFTFKMCDFKLGSLNINGAREDAKRVSLFNLFKSKRLNVIFLQETHSTQDNEAVWRKEWDGEIFLSHKSSNSGGVGILFSRDFTPISCDIDEIIEGRLLKIQAVFENVKITFFNVYAPTLGTERAIFFNTLNTAINNCNNDGYFFLGGDFNCTVNASLDRNHQEPHGPSKRVLTSLIEMHDLSDVWRVFHPTQRQYTWTHVKDNVLSMARLDRFYCFKHQINILKSCSIHPVGISDHFLVQVSIFIKDVKCKSAYWHFNVTLLSDKVFKEAFNFFWNNYSKTKSEYTSLQQWWDIGKIQIKQLCIQYSLNVTKDMTKSMEALENEIVMLQDLADFTGNGEHIKALKKKKSALSNLLGFSAKGALVRSRFQNVIKMDAPSHFFFGLERKNGQKRLIHSLRSSNGQLLKESEEIRKCAVTFYEKLFKKEYQENPEVAQCFYENLPKVTEEANAELRARISAEELHTALQSLENGKAPGLDGLPVDFYKVFWPIIGKDLLVVLRDSLTKGHLPLSCRRGILTLLPKKGDLQEIKNWRPVALLCTDYKLLSKVLAMRLKKVMEDIIHVDQTYCIPNRLISDNIFLIRDILDLSSSLGYEIGLISIDQEKAFDRVEHQYLWQTLEAFGFDSNLIAMIKVLYCDIESLLKINGGLSAPFKVQRGIRQGCSLSGMLYSIAIEPLLHKLRQSLSGVIFPGCESSFKLSAYADDVIVIVNQQNDVNSLKKAINDFGVLSSAKINWGKSEALAVGDELSKELVLPGGLVWKKDGLKYLGVYLGDNSFVCKNWENVFEKVEGRLRKWKWLLPHMSFRGRTLIINNLVASMLWHRLTCVEPPTQLLNKIQSVLVDFFWDRLHWVPQSVLFLSKEDGGQGLIHLASRGAAFRLQFIQRFLTGPAHLVWRPLARTILGRGGDLGLAESLFLMDLNASKISNLPKFYLGLFTVWGLFIKQRAENCTSLSWLLKEPIIYGSRFNVERTTGHSVLQLFRSAGVVTLGHVVNICGPNLTDSDGLASHVRVRSTRLLNQMLKAMNCELTEIELSLLKSPCNDFCQSNVEDPFPVLSLSPDFKNCTGQLLKLSETLTNELDVMEGKTMYNILVKILNKNKLNGRADTPWRAHLKVNSEIRPVWRTIYKPPLTKKIGDLQWKVLHGCVAVNAFVSVINPNVKDNCPFCLNRETVFHCFLECDRLSFLFELLQQMFQLFGEVFSKQDFIFGFRYNQKGRMKCQLFNFLFGQAKMAIYISRRNKTEGSLDSDANTIFVRMLKARLKIDFDFYSITNNVEEFLHIWVYENVLCSVVENVLCFGNLLV